jgi:tetratricopeptide (TPR) repeat protein
MLLAIDSLDPETVELLAGEGALPNLARLRREGAYGPLRSREPLVSPVVWTTIATGRTDHGIEGFVSGDDPPVPANRLMRKPKAVWNILSDAGHEVAVVGWWATWPAETVRGSVVSDRLCYHYLHRAAFEPKPVESLTSPEGLVREIAPLVRRPASVTFEEARPFVEVDERSFGLPFDFRDPLEHFKWAYATSESYRRIGLDLWRRDRPDLLMVYLEGLDTVCHLFGHLFRAPRPRPEGEAGEAQRRYGRTVEEMYRYADRIVGEYLAAMDERTTLVVLSDHGFSLGPIRPGEPASPGGRRIGARNHRLDGALFLYGSGVRRGARLVNASILDVTPTLLALIGKAPARDMPGRPLAEALSFEPAAPVPTYETGGPSPSPGRTVQAEAVDPEMLEHLKALGYIDTKTASPTPGAPTDLEALRAEAEREPDDPKALTRLADAYLGAGRPQEALEQARRALDRDPLYAPAHHALAAVHEERGRRELALREYRNALRCNPRFEPARRAYERLTGSPDPLAPRSASEKQAAELTARASRAAGVFDYRQALRHLEEAERLAPRYALIFQYRSNIYYLMGDRKAAIAALHEGLAIAPDDVLFKENLRRLLEGEDKPEAGPKPGGRS